MELLADLAGIQADWTPQAGTTASNSPWHGWLPHADLEALMREVVHQGMDIDDELYVAPSGPILVRDVIYGHHGEIERSGHIRGLADLGSICARAAVGNVLADSGSEHGRLIGDECDVLAHIFKGKLAQVAAAEFHRAAQRIDVYFYTYGPHEIWGVTARIMKSFIDTVFGEG